MYISIGIPFYNAENYLALAIESVINQSFKNWELILVNDGSKDKSLEIARRFESIDERIRVISDGKNKKLPYRLNQIINESKHDYIARMDADDIIHPDRLKIQMEFLQNNPQYDLVSTGVVSISEKNEVYGYRHVEKIYTSFDKINRSYPIIHASVLARKSWYQRNNYDINYPRSEDFELWCRTISKNDLKLAVLPDLLYYYREEGNLFIDKITRSYRDGFKIYQNYKGSFNVQQFIKYKAKYFIAVSMHKLGILQNLANIRNKKKVSKDTLENHQGIVDAILVFHKTIEKIK